MTGNSRMGRVSLPSCIACDRPLIEKVRRDQYVDFPGVGARPSTTSFDDSDAGMVMTARNRGSDRPNLQSLRVSVGATEPRPGYGGIQGNMVTLQPSPQFFNTRDLQPQPSDPYVLRAGFKMPASASRGGRRDRINGRISSPITDTL